MLTSIVMPRQHSYKRLLIQVTIGSIAAALLGFAGSDSKKEHQPTENLVEIIAMILLPVAVLMVAYALMVFVWRAKAIAKKQVSLLSTLHADLLNCWCEAIEKMNTCVGLAVKHQTIQRHTLLEVAHEVK